ncbi:MAG: IS630 family transposase [Janthinobacterium lividum]
MQNLLTTTQIKDAVGELDELAELVRRVQEGRLSERNKAVAVLASYNRIPSRVVCDFLGIARNTVRKYRADFEQGGTAALFGRRSTVVLRADDEKTKQSVFALLHEPPASHGINRTTWKMEDLIRVLRSQGCPACSQVVRQITKAAGYKWRKARTVLTSRDPDYVEKVARVHGILSGLNADEAFFSIDEFGPFAVKMKGGLSLMPAGQQRIVPQWQRSKGCLILTAALELSGNQVSHFYSTAKNTGEMIRMMDTLVEQYAHCSRIYLSWDAASWHISKLLGAHIEQHNQTAEDHHRPCVEVAPLPVGAQFLNVIESVFSGMARAIIHNSDYASLDVAKEAIDRYFAERNAQFRHNPRRAGNKIWGKERVAPVFNAANSCKDPNYR